MQPLSWESREVDWYTASVCWGFVKTVHSGNCVNDSTARQEVELWMLRCGLWKGHCILQANFTSPSQWIITPMEFSDLWAALQMLGAVPVWGLTSTHWLPLFVCVHVCVCVWAWQNGRGTGVKVLLKWMWACLFHSVLGCVSVFLSACVRRLSRSRVSLLVTGYSNVSLYWVLIDCFLNWEMWPLKPNGFECVTEMPPHTFLLGY